MILLCLKPCSVSPNWPLRPSKIHVFTTPNLLWLQLSLFSFLPPALYPWTSQMLSVLKLTSLSRIFFLQWLAPLSTLLKVVFQSLTSQWGLPYLKLKHFCLFPPTQHLSYFIIYLSIMFVSLSPWLPLMLQRIPEVKYRDFLSFDCFYIWSTYHIVDSKCYVNDWMINSLSSEIIGSIMIFCVCVEIYLYICVCVCKLGK